MRNIYKEPHPFGQLKLEPGVHTDDLRYRYLACQSIIRRGCMVTGSELAEEMLNFIVSCTRKLRIVF